MANFESKNPQNDIFLPTSQNGRKNYKREGLRFSHELKEILDVLYLILDLFMTRIKRGVTSHRRHKKLLKSTKGYSNLRSRIVKWAKNASYKAGQNSYVGRKRRRRDLRSLWITRVNAACHEGGLNYSRFIYGLLKAKVKVDRKILAELAVKNPDVFAKFVEVAKG